MVRLHFVVEGQTEETFVNQVLRPYLGGFNIVSDARCVETRRIRRLYEGRLTERTYKGGSVGYSKAKRDLIRWMKQDKNSDAYFTTMFDLYGLKDDFPGFHDCSEIVDPYKRISMLEEAFEEDITRELDDPRFIPYIQLHEFEALILSRPEELATIFVNSETGVQNLVEICGIFESPELIDDNPETAPSKRIIKEIPEYEGMKQSAGPLIASKIGIDHIRMKCAHFNEWITKLERLSAIINN